MNTAKACPGPFLVAAHCHGARTTEATAAAVAARWPRSDRRGAKVVSQYAAERAPALRRVTELKPQGIECDLPRGDGSEKTSRALGTARVLEAIYSSPSAEWLGCSVAAGVAVFDEEARRSTSDQSPADLRHGQASDTDGTRQSTPESGFPRRDWTALLQRRGSLLASQVPPDLPERFVRDDGHPDPRRLYLDGIVASRLRTPSSPRLCDSRLAWHGEVLDAAMLNDHGQAAAIRRAHLLQPGELGIALSIAADLAFVGWLAAEVTHVVSRLRVGNLEPHSAIEYFLDLDDLRTSHYVSDHAAETRILLGAFNLDEQWARLSTRLTLASILSLLKGEHDG